MDALALLKEDHDTIKKILMHLECTTENGVRTREEFYTRVKHELQVHEAIEEEILYPALKEHPRANGLVLEAYREHHVVDVVMAELDETAFDDETWSARFTVLKENLEHHIDEEESEMFEQCRQVFDADELQELGDEMEARKEELESASAA